MTSKKPRILATMVMLMMGISSTIFPTGMHYGQSGRPSTRCERNSVWNIREQYEQRMRYLNKPKYKGERK